VNKSELQGKVQTVLGLIPPEDVGITLPHEHVLTDLTVFFKEPEAAGEKLLAHQPVSLENLWWVRYHPFNNRDNLCILDEQMAINELLRYKYAGGSSVVDMSCIGMSRDPLALARISRATGLNIIMGTGYYLEETWPPGLTEEMMAEEMIKEITVGVGDTGIRAGIIGEIGTEMIGGIEAGYKATVSLEPEAIHLGENYKMLLRAVAHAPPFETIDLLGNAGVDIGRVVISHIDRTVFAHDTRVKLAKTGCYLEYDIFSWEGYHPVRHVLSEDNPVKCDLPNDAGRVNEIMALIEEGFLNQILISQDQCIKTRLCNYGGPGYAHILQNVVPLIMREKDMPEEHINALLSENPKRLLTFT
jgi:phosphotriesterase-related protein